MQKPSRNFDGAVSSNLVANKVSLVRLTLSITLAVLFLQFLMGMWLNLFASFPTSASLSSGMMGMISTSMSSMMSGGMSLLMLHMLSGYLLGILALIVLAVSIYSKKTMFVALSILGLGSIALAGISGLSFMFSGFQDNLVSYLMSLGFISAFMIYFIELYISAKPLH
ncbi:MAG: hypothetical protein ACYC7D_10935 [Nitrososphaerales archaeon]